MFPPFEHQQKTTDFILATDRVLVTSDPGTGKTRSVLDAYAARKEKGRMLVLAPLSILQASWGDDADVFQPTIKYSIAYAKNRAEAFAADTDIVITNHDAVKWIAKNMDVLDGFTMLCIDEFTAFKNKDSQRSKAAGKVARHFDYRVAMSGTPNSNTILDIWHPTLLVDDGQRLGNRFYSFRSQVCTPKFNGYANEWVPKENAEELVASQIFDINIRYMLEECIDMPEKVEHTILTDLPPGIMRKYKQLSEESVLDTADGHITAVHAGARVRKLLQLCTGAVYDSEGDVVKVHGDRYEMVMQLVEEREHSLVAFNWHHERDELCRLADKKKIKYGVIDGSTKPEIRTKIVKDLQAGELQTVFCHPQSAGHGLTMTRADRIIWCSPTYNAEHFTQFNRRIYRAGQDKRTETIMIAARGTWEPAVYKKLAGKVSDMKDLLGVLSELSPT